MELNGVKKIIGVIIINLIIFMQISFAETIELTSNKTNVLFIVDKSNSMNNINKKEIIKNISKKIIDKLYDENTEFSYITYNQNIINFTKNMNINSQDELDLFEKKISSNRNSGYSDLGLGLKKSKDIIFSKDYKKDKFLIVLMTDGDITVPKYKNRSEEESKEDIKDTVKILKDSKIPIVTLDFNLDKHTNFLENISKETNGIYYNVFSNEYTLDELGSKIFDIKENMNKILELKIPDQIKKNEEFFVQAVFKDSSGEIIKNKDFYNDFKLNAYLLNEDNKYNLVPKIFDYKILLKNKVLNSGNYNLKLGFENNYLKYEYIKTGFDITNQKPNNNFYTDIKLPISKEQKIYDLNDYFTDMDNDLISYKLFKENKNLKLVGNKLYIKRNSLNDFEFKLIYYDNENSINQTEFINIKIVSKLDYYKNYIMLGFIITILILIFYIYRLYKDENKKNFNGKLNMYFIRTKDYNEIEPLTFYIYEYENYKKLSLFELFEKEYLEFENINLKKIYFRPYYNNKIKLVNHSNATVMINSNILRKYECEVLDYKSNIHITFEDNYTELEIHFRKI
ncbi:MAG: VWA domain-containing protein [Peptostreptococcaceae bacterium]|jgi:Mg-chelatase subunit ChlD|nr:VWA domain-containing protein [Peptostreptococcaceae bacterium]